MTKKIPIPAWVAGLCLTLSAQAGVIFQDDFESGDLSNSAGGFYHNSVRAKVLPDKPKAGQYSLRMRLQGGADGQDSWAEQRIHLNGQYTSVWIKYDIFLPSNYTHRSQSGGVNNKFIGIYRAPYAPETFHNNFSLSPNGSGGSNLQIHRFRNGAEQPILRPSLGRDFITATDLGKWSQILIHVQVPSNSGASDGVMQMWKNGVLVADYKNLDNYGGNGVNFIDEIYLVGWANSGFAQDTDYYFDNLVISDTPIVFSPPAKTTVTVQ